MATGLMLPSGSTRLSRLRASGLCGGILLFVVVATALVGPSFYSVDPFALTGASFLPPSSKALFGTDGLGRDMLAGVVYGSRTTLTIGIMATLVAVAIGTAIGAAAGYHGGFADAVLMRLTDAFQTLPSFIFAIVLVAILGPGILNTILVIGIVSWPPMARLVRGEVLSLRERDYIRACIGLGMSNMRIICGHLLPNCLTAILTVGALMVATSILLESGLSFLGLTDPSVMSWGALVKNGQTVMRTAWWVTVFPGVAILLTVMAINLVGEALAQAFNPQLEKLV